jgi:hypothetical protein
MSVLGGRDSQIIVRLSQVAKRIVRQNTAAVAVSHSPD